MNLSTLFFFKIVLVILDSLHFRFLKLAYQFPQKNLPGSLIWIKMKLQGWEVRGGVQDWELMYTRGEFMSMYGKTNTVL